MKQTRVDVRVERSRAQLMASLSELARERPLGEISVSELCAAAGVSRPTFYQHFASVDDVLTASLDERLARIILMAAPQGPHQDIPATIAQFLAELARERRDYQVLLSQNAVPGGPAETLAAWMVKSLGEHFAAGPESARALTFASAGIVAVVRSWLKEPLDASNDLDELASLIWRMTTDVLAPRPRDATT